MYLNQYSWFKYSLPHCRPSENLIKYSQPFTGPNVALSLAFCSEPSYQVPPLPADFTPLLVHIEILQSYEVQKKFENQVLILFLFFLLVEYVDSPPTIANLSS